MFPCSILYNKNWYLLGVTLAVSCTLIITAIWDLSAASSSSRAEIFCWVNGSADDTADTEDIEIDASNGVDVRSTK